jgi:hypothetical protein
LAPVFYFPLLGTPTAEGNLLSFFEAGTAVPLDVWTDSDLTIPWAQPIVFNAAAEAPGPIYVSSTPSYKVVYTDADGAAIPGYPLDFVAPSTIINVTTSLITPLTNAQILTLPTTGVTVRAAPASGLRVKFLGVTVVINTTAGAYTNINTTKATLQIQTASGNWLSIGAVNDSVASPALTQVTGFLQNGGKALMDWGPYAGLQQTTPHGWVIPWGADSVSGNYDATALELAMDNNGSGNLTGGNAANTGSVTLYYALESVA